MMTAVLTIILSIVLASATVGQAAKSMDAPLAFSIYDNETNCKGRPKATGTITSLTAIDGNGAFCENTVQNLADGSTVTVYTKVVLTSCDAISLGYVFVDAYTCTDTACSDCTDVDQIPVSANLLVPEFDPTPAVDTCWGVEATSTGITVLNQFDKNADAEGVASYWSLYTENSCLGETVTILSDSNSAAAAGVSLAATSFLAAAASLALLAWN